MTDKRLKQIEKQIRKIKEDLLQILEMRPGTLTIQYRNPKDKKGAFYQLSYTYKMKGKSEYVRPQHVAALKQQIKTYKKFKSLIEKWVDLSLEYSKLKIDLANRNQLK
jgi:hypothetical protein